MSHVLLSVALILAGPGQAQTQTAPGDRPGSEVTRSLNASPPSAAVAPPPAATRLPPPASAPTVVPPSTPAPSSGGVTTAPAATPSARPTAATVPTRPAVVVPAAAPPVTSAPSATAPTAPVTPPTAAPAAPAPTMTVLDAPAIAALPFAIDLPAGLTITTGRPGPNFDIWTIRRGQQPLVMVYAGPASQFPIYSGEMVQAGGRASVVANEDGRRVALEHMFARQSAPREIHAWITSVEGADRALAERIAQSIDPR